jgi:hypothetical protein
MSKVLNEALLKLQESMSALRRFGLPRECQYLEYVLNNQQTLFEALVAEHSSSVSAVGAVNTTKVQTAGVATSEANLEDVRRMASAGEPLVKQPEAPKVEPKPVTKPERKRLEPVK